LTAAPAAWPNGSMELRQIARDVYACLQEDRGLGYSNSGLVATGGGLVVDTFWDLPHTRAMIDLYAGVLSDPAQRVVNTHHNGDHCWGNQLFPDAELIGHRLCAAAFGKESPALMSALRGMADADDPAVAAFARGLADWDFTGVEPTPPTTLIDDRLDLELGGVPVSCLYVGPAHTQSDVIVHLPEQRIVFTGDILFRLCTPIGWEGTFAKWREALDTIVALGPDVVVPGHGPLCGVEGPREMKAYLEYVEREARDAFAAGLTAVDAAKRMDLGPYANWTEPQRLVFNVMRAYRELRGEPWDAPVDVAAVMQGMHELERHWQGVAAPR
jgi:cyclase